MTTEANRKFLNLKISVANVKVNKTGNVHMTQYCGALTSSFYSGNTKMRSVCVIVELMLYVSVNYTKILLHNSAFMINVYSTGNNANCIYQFLKEIIFNATDILFTRYI